VHFLVELARVLARARERAKLVPQAIEERHAIRRAS
jgi:hypothetical protein